MNILIKNISFKEEPVDIYIEGNIIKRIDKVDKTDKADKVDKTDKTDKTDKVDKVDKADKVDKIDCRDGACSVSIDKIIDGTGKAVIAGLVNGHTHSAMTLFRGWGDDMPLEQWLTEKIWPYEAKLTDDMVYWGTKLACLEMIKSGTTCFNDMYWHLDASVKAIEESGLRATIASVILDPVNSQSINDVIEPVLAAYKKSLDYNDRISYALAPHAIYTVSKEIFKWVRDFSKENDLLIHTHVAETQTEYDNCVKEHGMSPIRYLNSLGLLSPRLIIAHCLWLDDEEIQMLADNDVKVIHNPNSNLKLASGYRFKYHEMKDAGITVGIGTDGCSSSNNLDMIEAMKVASLIGKAWREDPTAMPAREMFRCAALNGGKILRQNTGQIKEGFLADLVLIDLKTPAFTPNFNFISNLIYAANGNNVDTVICNGKILMENKHVEGEEEILHMGNVIADKLFFNKNN
ncbi:amidohydrolase [Odoribacter sp. OttesenSCG-928-L07]|nr:amidohydrolase [Odoribacter sp. OttesenSCG-928-L07]MDL2238601.1 amidohydrolase [Bacteroidales bacterium OttesenSCG-928-L14]MDL2240915.1 amidohydrolase [Bacteroidales bacterium OttesenSCG-928-K22]